jgi:hypothetical protein
VRSIGSCRQALPGDSWRARGVADVDGESCGGGREERGRIPDPAPVGSVPANPGVLHNVLRFSGAAEDPVGDGEQARAQGFERRRVGLGDARGIRHGGP